MASQHAFYIGWSYSVFLAALVLEVAWLVKQRRATLRRAREDRSANG